MNGASDDVRTTDVLLVEDDDSDVTVARRAFDRAELPPLEVVRDGEQALAVLGLDGYAHQDLPLRPRVIFLDLRLPKVDGFDLLRHIRAAPDTRDIPVVVVSSSAREDDVRQAYRLGANSFLVKRFDGGRPGGYLVEAARYWLALNRAPAPREGMTP